MKSARDLINFIVNCHQFENISFDNKSKFAVDLIINNNVIQIDLKNNSFFIEGIKYDHARIFDLTKFENHSVVMLLILLFFKGYSKDCIYLEKSIRTGHGSAWLDVMLTNPKNDENFMIEVKTKDEIKKYLNNKDDTIQLFSYKKNNDETTIISYYTYNFDDARDEFYNIFIDDNLKNSKTTDDFYDRWNKNWDISNYISNNDVFFIKPRVIKYEELVEIKDDDTKKLFNQFLTILRLHSISDKPNAFIKMINLLLAKIGDEFSGNKEFHIKDKQHNIHKIYGLKFQFFKDVDTPESFIKRLNELYKIGMKQYLNQEIIDYTDDEINNLLDNGDNDKLIEIIDNLRVKKSNYFAFFDVFDEKTFLENFEIVKSMVELLSSYRFKYDKKYDFLGDFFESLLNTSLKQEAGQFFTPYPIVDFMVKSLPFKEHIEGNIRNGIQDIAPKIIDYACGAGHFLISAMSTVQEILIELNNNSNKYTDSYVKRLKAYKEAPYTWVKGNVVGIEKDYRLAKTSKIATFLNGDGDADILYADGINRFDSDDYKNTILYNHGNKNEIFDFVISNPPYSVDGFVYNFYKNNINEKSKDFELLKNMNYKDSAIEKYFVERAWQLCKKNGYVSIILPQSILSNEKYSDLRNYIFSKFRVYTLLLTADITFKGTTTSPVILFMKKENVKNLGYDTLIIYSPKYKNPTISKLREQETKFLGYEFSENRNKTGINILKGSILEKLIDYNNNFLKNEKIIIPQEYEQYMKIVKMKDIIINNNKDYFGDIYPKFKKYKGKTLKNFCKINKRTENDFKIVPNNYFEIGNFTIKKYSKDKKTNRFAKKGDIIISSLNPTAKNIEIADNDYMCSTAIYVLHDFENSRIKKEVLSRLKSDEVLEQMNSMCDGFKSTYSKISEYNLYNNVRI